MDLLEYKEWGGSAYFKNQGEALVCIPCLITHNAYSPLYIIQTRPKKSVLFWEKAAFHQPVKYWLTDIQVYEAKKRRRIHLWFERMSPFSDDSYSKVFQTLSDAPNALKDIREFMTYQRNRLTRSGIEVVSSMWVLENKRTPQVDQETGEFLGDKFHCHYHIVWITKRTKRIRLFYLSDVWGRRVNAKFIEGDIANVKRYLFKYLSKTADHSRAINRRNFAIGRINTRVLDA